MLGVAGLATLADPTGDLASGKSEVKRKIHTRPLSFHRIDAPDSHDVLDSVDGRLDAAGLLKGVEVSFGGSLGRESLEDLWPRLAGEAVKAGHRGTQVKGSLGEERTKDKSGNTQNRKRISQYSMLIQYPV